MAVPVAAITVVAGHNVQAGCGSACLHARTTTLGDGRAAQHKVKWTFTSYPVGWTGGTYTDPRTRTHTGVTHNLITDGWEGWELCFDDEGLAGDFGITLTVTDKDGDADTETTTITRAAFTGNTYYIDPDAGSDSNSGAIGSKWLTPGKAFTSGTTPMRILLKRGNTLPHAGPGTITTKNNWWVNGLGWNTGAKATLVQTAGSCFNIDDCDNWSVTDLTMDGNDSDDGFNWANTSTGGMIRDCDGGTAVGSQVESFILNTGGSVNTGLLIQNCNSGQCAFFGIYLTNNTTVNIRGNHTHPDGTNSGARIFDTNTGVSAAWNKFSHENENDVIRWLVQYGTLVENLFTKTGGASNNCNAHIGYQDSGDNAPGRHFRITRNFFEVPINHTCHVEDMWFFSNVMDIAFAATVIGAGMGETPSNSDGLIDCGWVYNAIGSRRASMSGGDTILGFGDSAELATDYEFRGNVLFRQNGAADGNGSYWISNSAVGFLAKTGGITRNVYTNRTDSDAQYRYLNANKTGTEWRALTGAGVEGVRELEHTETAETLETAGYRPASAVTKANGEAAPAGCHADYYNRAFSGYSGAVQAALTLPTFTLRDGANATYGTGLDGGSYFLPYPPGTLLTIKLRNDSGGTIHIDETGSASFGLTLGNDVAAAVANGDYYTFPANVLSTIPVNGLLTGTIQVYHDGADSPFDFTFTWAGGGGIVQRRRKRRRLVV